jgi:hypothetical protein
VTRIFVAEHWAPPPNQEELERPAVELIFRPLKRAGSGRLRSFPRLAPWATVFRLLRRLERSLVSHPLVRCSGRKEWGNLEWVVPTPAERWIG